jgi:hypothetical protein
MDKKEKADRAKKRGNRNERTFHKDEADFVVDAETKEKETHHLRVYGVKTFEDEAEKSGPEAPPLDEIAEEKQSGEDSDNGELTEDKPKPPRTVPTEEETPPAKTETPDTVEPPKIVSLDGASKEVDLDVLKERLKTEDLGISESDLERVKRAREERERARMEREIEQQKLKVLADQARLEFEQKQKAKDKFKPKKRK